MFYSRLFLLVILISSCSRAVPRKSEDWKIVSNRVAEEFARDVASRYPEAGSSLGWSEYDPHVVQIKDDMETDDKKFIERWNAKLTKLQDETDDLELDIDYAVLLTKLIEMKTDLGLREKFNEIPYALGSKNIFSSLQGLINPQSPASRKHAAVDRFRNYILGENGGKPYMPACLSRSKYYLSKNTQGFYPLRSEIEEYLSQSDSFQKGVKELLEKSGRSDWKETYEIFLTQVRESDEFLRKEILPRARTDYKLPEEIYNYVLAVRGIRANPRELVKMAKEDFKLYYSEFEKIAKVVARKRKMNSSHPVKVIRELKKKQITKADDVRKMYEAADQKLKEIITTNNLVSLPESPLKIRLAGDAESKASPVPHLLPPRLINNKGERPEFIVPTASDGKMPFDDFSYEAASVILTAHEGRPGHDLQFSSMLDNGVSIIRARYAANSVNIEGWGLYAELLVEPYLSDESKLIALQSRLWRTARAFLEPELQLGLITQDDVIKTYTEKVGISTELAKLEVRRYTYDDPGQAPSYYYGFKRILETKKQFQERVGSSFTEKCFNDGVLNLGLLPVNIIAGRMAQINCQ